jgi:uncharacterized protein YbcC (UPF0753/DUF2309 family)
MNSTAVLRQAPTDPAHSPVGQASLEQLKHVIEHAAHLLPAQGPITVFIHHNTLHAFEHLPFDEGVKKGAQVFGCQPYLSENRYREELARGRIRFSELQEVLAADLADRADEIILLNRSRMQVHLAMLEYPLRTGPTEELVWFVAETDALRKIRAEASSAVRAQLIAETRRWAMRDLRGGNETAHNGRGDRHAYRIPECLIGVFERFEGMPLEEWEEEDWEGFTLQALWRVCCAGVSRVPAPPPPPASERHRDLLLRATGTDIDILVNDVLIRFAPAFLDQGFAHWPLPRREEGIYRCFCALYRQSGGPPDRWLRELPRELARLEDSHISPLQSVLESLELLGVPEGEWEPFLCSTFLALRGWAGMVQQIEQRGDRVAQPAPPGSLIELLAIRLLLKRLALAYTARQELAYSGPLAGLRDELRCRLSAPTGPSIEQRAFQVFQLAQVLGFSPDILHRLSVAEWTRFINEIEAFSGIERRRIFHLAYERRFCTQSLDALTLHTANLARQGKLLSHRPRYQAVFCLDEREESMRRHLEEIADDVETFGVAGFYGVAMYYRGAADAHFVPLCPVVIRPQHWVTEEVADEVGEMHRLRARTRKALGAASLQFHVGSRSIAVGALLTGLFGVLASFPLVASILFPRLTSRIRQIFGRFVQTPLKTRLQLERKMDSPGPDNGHVGYSIEEMADSAERLLREMGLTESFAPLVLLLGHGSNSLNNPHNSAYNCGACGGAAGGPNARAMAHILNDPRVRHKLEQRRLVIPEQTVFVGGYHNTCNDSVTFFDLDRIPATHQQEFDSARQDIEATCARNAHERCRRFMSAPLTMSFAEARQHVEERSEDLSQTRPECGHATNALCIVGRREWTRGLYLDRRAFLTSYDPTQDDSDSSILARILSAVFPVCAGINLEYYFSYVDSPGYGCGTKLPHNLTALLGVMDGAASDLRTGLPWQMVEIHEPVRLLIVIETTPSAMLGIMKRNTGIDQLCRNGWVLLALLDPETHKLRVFENGEFKEYKPQATLLPTAESSVDWYRGSRDHLEFAEISRAGG